MGSGKSTISSELSKALPDYVLVDRAYFKDTMLTNIKKQNRELAITLSKEIMFFISKKLLGEGYNIILTEIRISKVKEMFGEKYPIHSFYLECSLEECQRRDAQRQNKYDRPERVKEMHEKHAHSDKEDIIIDTEKNSVKDCVGLILKQIEKK